VVSNTGNHNDYSVTGKKQMYFGYETTTGSSVDSLLSQMKQLAPPNEPASYHCEQLQRRNDITIVDGKRIGYMPYPEFCRKGHSKVTDGRWHKKSNGFYRECGTCRKERES
jgi:hypothetical protein